MLRNRLKFLRFDFGVHFLWPREMHANKKTEQKNNTRTPNPRLDACTQQQYKQRATQISIGRRLLSHQMSNMRARSIASCVPVYDFQTFKLRAQRRLIHGAFTFFVLDGVRCWFRLLSFVLSIFIENGKEHPIGIRESRRKETIRCVRWNSALRHERNVHRAVWTNENEIHPIAQTHTHTHRRFCTVQTNTSVRCASQCG